jgi:hypothetical protein
MTRRLASAPAGAYHRTRMIAFSEVGAARTAALASDTVSLYAGVSRVDRACGRNVERDRVFLAPGVSR